MNEGTGTAPERLDALADAAAALAGELSVESVLETVLCHARRLTGARYAALGVLGDDGLIERFLTEGLPPEHVARIGSYPTGKGVLGELIRDPRPLRLDDVTAHPASVGFPAEHPPMGSFLGAPIRSSGTVYGNLYLTDKPAGFDVDDERTVLVLAAQAGAAIENATLSERLRELAVQDERDRISRELHDGVIQTLFSLGMGLDAARELIAVDPGRADARIDEAVEAIDGAIRELRNFIFQLRPEHAASMGFARGLTELAREYEVNALVRPRLEIPSDVDARLPARLVPDLLAVVRESLSNAAKHARASEVTIRVRMADGIELSVADDGVGFSGDTLHTGRGLENIRERARALGADLDLRSTPGEGTELRLAIPRHAAGSEDEQEQV
ncbi:MAG: GAF domain-containing sensor histidine kinase [Actinomycetota bacterium]